MPLRRAHFELRDLMDSIRVRLLIAHDLARLNAFSSSEINCLDMSKLISSENDSRSSQQYTRTDSALAPVTSLI